MALVLVVLGALLLTRVFPTELPEDGEVSAPLVGSLAVWVELDDDQGGTFPGEALGVTCWAIADRDDEVPDATLGIPLQTFRTTQARLDDWHLVAALDAVDLGPYRGDDLVVHCETRPGTVAVQAWGTSVRGATGWVVAAFVAAALAGGGGLVLGGGGALVVRLLRRR
ncbi:hypothetical protein [Mumia sp. DW29H23]|uniref:hypothetical protein n=1 Tax=Mumia sp. DW29H23 TaxID=3421241 RepID=UPI003D68334B